MGNNEILVLFAIAVAGFFMQPKHIWKQTIQSAIHNGSTTKNGVRYSNRFNVELDDIPKEPFARWQLFMYGIVFTLILVFISTNGSGAV